DTTAPTVTVTAPNGGENWAVGSTHSITWSASDDVGVTSVDILYSTTGASGTFTAIASGVANTGSYSWKVPNTPSSNAFVEVVAHDAAANSGTDLSDAAFTISAPPGSANNMYVWDQSWSVSQRGSWITVSVTVSVKRDTNANNIAEASDGPASGAVMNYV